ncbi:LysR substrate-binding domain-containing protein [Sphingomonas sp. AOB5]|uniref:LysR substrate-binding domain-containing protein n=1 Tax=Sphingomonas sp. AOB5 TaxID=3034017 RepID=UPI0023F8B511|nr:LysR substrate-binding domain-containing protein [Sphingomonas sp. AOB5]MDF7776713.1 LysR substrate-binding domain-containing protein [Sphingomonas sp. AOB5]
MRPPHIELRHLYAFLVVAEELHFGRAAVRLGIAQPPLSQQIKRIEEAIGHRLLDRDTRNVSLTPAGEAFAETARAILQQLSAGVERARDVASGAAGRLGVGFTPTTALRLLPRTIPVFRAEHPRIEIDLIELMPAPLVEALRMGQIDVAIMRDPTPAPGVVATVLHNESYVAVLPTGHAHASGPFTLADLAGDPFILFPSSSESQTVGRVFGLCAEAGFVPRGVQQVPGWQTAISMVGSGMGVTILPESVENLQLPGIVYRRLESPIRSTIAAVVREGEARPMVTGFIARSTAIMSA